MIGVMIPNVYAEKFSLEGLVGSNLMFEIELPDGWTQNESSLDFWRMYNSNDRSIVTVPSLELSSSDKKIQVFFMRDNIGYSSGGLSFCKNNMDTNLYYCESASNRTLSHKDDPKNSGKYRYSISEIPYKTSDSPLIKSITIVGYQSWIGSEQSSRDQKHNWINVLFVFDEEVAEQTGFRHQNFIRDIRAINDSEDLEDWEEDYRKIEKSC